MLRVELSVSGPAPHAVCGALTHAPPRQIATGETFNAANGDSRPMDQNRSVLSMASEHTFNFLRLIAEFFDAKARNDASGYPLPGERTRPVEEIAGDIERELRALLTTDEA